LCRPDTINSLYNDSSVNISEITVTSKSIIRRFFNTRRPVFHYVILGVKTWCDVICMPGGPVESNLSQRRKDFEQFQSYLTFSQLYAKATVPNICSIPIQASTAGDCQGVYSHFDDTLIKTPSMLNPRRTTWPSADMPRRYNNMMVIY